MAIGTYIPVSGWTAPDGSLLALQNLTSQPGLITPPQVSWSGGDSVNVKSFSASAALMASVGFGGLAVSGQSNVVYWVMDILATMDEPGPGGASPVASWIFGVGLRLGIRGIGVSGSASSSVEGLAAGATLKGTSASLQFKTIGVGFPAMKLLGGLVSQSVTGFDVGTLQEVGDLISDFTAFLANPENVKRLSPQVVGVIFETGPQAQTPAASYGWALRGIEKGMSYRNLMSKTSKPLPPGVKIDPGVVEGVYLEIVESVTNNPNEDQRRLASQLTHSGP